MGIVCPTIIMARVWQILFLGLAVLLYFQKQDAVTNAETVLKDWLKVETLAIRVAIWVDAVEPAKNTRQGFQDVRMGIELAGVKATTSLTAIMYRVRKQLAAA